MRRLDVATTCLLVCVILVGMMTGLQCAAKPTTADGAQVLGFSAALLHCQALGEEAGSYKVYKACADAIDGGQ